MGSEKLKAESRKPKGRLKGFLLFVFCFSLVNCTTPSDKKNDSFSSKFTQYYNQGEQLYQKNCSNCHQKNGSGLGRVYPPLNNSDYLKNNFAEAICLIRNGTKGGIIVNGINFNQPMPGIPTLTDLEIAEIATYIYNSWSNNRGMIEVKDVSNILQRCTLNPINNISDQ